eukprot:TRINITY_DN75165_c0_g1_i1.p1 TRINITY_DN75165_c0_g1~~TRINITY_DN75165_c0_g1_i1.p1  ORF type:complete len:834 (+),score=168.17 TRINITY_DN75165_c0_g1_i1:87-2588(+)
MPDDGLGICEGGKAGVFFPLGGEWERNWDSWVKIILYGFALGYGFAGVNIGSDVFMNAIETITSKKVCKWDAKLNRHRTVKLWNDTVANLTLMALGSSAPEIMLSLIEVLQEGFYAGDMGPSTIVGSAAFNLFSISAVCVVAIPSPEIRSIRDTSVYILTASFSIFAYLWLLFVITVTSPDAVDLWEAVLTLLFFPIMVGLAFAADKGMFGAASERKAIVGNLSREELDDLVQEVRDEFKSLQLDNNAVMELVQRKITSQATKSRAMYRVESNRMMQRRGARKIMRDQRYESSKIRDTINARASAAALQAQESLVHPTSFNFSTTIYAVSEAAGKVVLPVVCTRGDAEEDGSFVTMRVGYQTVDGTALSGDDYTAVNGELIFRDGDTIQEIVVEILDDDVWEAAEDFFVELHHPIIEDPSEGYDVDAPVPRAVLGPRSTAQITIIDDDDPGVLSFEKDLVQVEESGEDQTVMVKVMRKYGSQGAVSCKCNSENDSAVEKLDFDEVDEVVRFEGGQLFAEVPVVVKKRTRFDANTCKFRLVLGEDEGARERKSEEGDVDVCWLVILPNEAHQASVDALSKVLGINWHKAQLGTDNWKEQFAEAFMPGGSLEEACATPIGDWVLHIVLMPWKVAFACVPPPEFMGGWLCFTFSLLGIGVLTAGIGDLAALFGCSLGISKSVTAITFVALGTSLPDTFASMGAAQQDPSADASIGNIVGSNSVNVFLGLGLPWTAASIYWKIVGMNSEWESVNSEYVSMYPKAAFIVKGQELGYLVCVFAVLAVTTISFMGLRRKLIGGELGGPFLPKIASGALLVLIWVTYVIAACMRSVFIPDD